jgi:4-amino-4-deoxy-L-arabinose transferase-like glycosyltransferase
MKSWKFLLGLILILALALRLIGLGRIPAGFSPDEASQAYTAYSLLQTGKDEWGVSWPIVSFKSFLDYKAPLQTYLMIPSIAVFGLNEFAARLPSVIFGVLAIFAIYLLSAQLFPTPSSLRGGTDLPAGRQAWQSHSSIPLFAALFLAISPWHIQFSRTALEVNLTSFLFPLGLYFFLRFLKASRTNNFALLTAICWGLSLYAYHSAKIFIPLFALSLLFLYRKEIFTSAPRTNNHALIAAFIAFLVILSPLAVDSVFGNSAKRGSDLLISNLSSESRSRLDDQGFYSSLAKISPSLPRLIHSPVFTIISEFADNYLSYFSLPFWFTEGGRETTYSVIPGRGLLLFWMLPLVLYGLFLLFKKLKTENYDARPLLLWLLLAALPAALTKEGYRPNRAGSFLGLWEIIAAFGFVSLLEIKFRSQKIILIIFISLAVTLTGFYLEDYFFNSSVTYPQAISFGWRDTINAVGRLQGNYDTVMVEKGTQSQSFVAFYLKIPPRDFQTATTIWQAEIEERQVTYLDQLGNYRLGKYSFEALNWPEDHHPDTLYVWQGKSLLPSDRHTIYQVITPQGEIIMEVFDFKK